MVSITLLTMIACQKKSPELVTITGSTMGTTYEVKLVPPPMGVNPDRLKPQIDQLLAGVNRQMSSYQEDSELSRFNRLKGAGPVEISAPFARVLRKGLEIAQKTDGAYDITIGPLVNLWGFGSRGLKEPVTPDQSRISQAIGSSGYQKLTLNGNQLSKVQADLQIDLSSIAKGYAVDLVARLLEGQQIEHFIVEIGGELKAKGKKGDRPWRIAVEKPLVGVRDVQKVLPLNNMALATSGDYRNYLEIAGTRYSHILDPKTGYPITHRLASVSVFAASCMIADGWATALMVLGEKQGLKLADREGLAVLFLIKWEQGFRLKASKAYLDLYGEP